MMSKLYVTNLAQVASMASVRQCFAACGDVLDVEMLPERGAYQSTGSAYVRMSNAAGAQRATARLHGTLLHGRSLMISAAPEEERARKRSHKKEEPETSARITQQYRERASMTYELACQGVRLTVRMFFPEALSPSNWRVEVSTNGVSASAAQASHTSRELALRAAADAWRALPRDAATLELDWPAIEAALKSVRAV
jgi:RNA recognition motif-containing protein